MKKLGVLGSGSWGTALAVHIAARGTGGEPGRRLEVVLWARRAEFAEQIEKERRNEEYLPGVAFPDNLHATHEMARVADADVILVVVPSHGYREVVQQLFAELKAHPPRDGAGEPKIIVSGTKGIETETLERMSEVTAEEADQAGVPVRFAVLAGPSFAAELARDMPTAAVVATRDEELGRQLRSWLGSPYFRLYSTADVAGVELAGTTKNVIAIASGVVAGLGLGHNTTAALLTRGLHEITRLAVACGGDPRTLAGLGGMGDLVLTCTGGLSRNRQTGVELAHGRTLAEISGSTSQVAEGVRNSLAISKLAHRHGVVMPITEEMVRVLYEGKHPRQSIESLMSRSLRAEAEL